MYQLQAFYEQGKYVVHLPIYWPLGGATGSLNGSTRELYRLGSACKHILVWQFSRFYFKVMNILCIEHMASGRRYRLPQWTATRVLYRRCLGHKTMQLQQVHQLSCFYSKVTDILYVYYTYDFQGVLQAATICSYKDISWCFEHVNAHYVTFQDSTHSLWSIFCAMINLSGSYWPQIRGCHTFLR